MHYNFYFDETFHDRKITIKPSGVINTFTENKNDSYVGIFWGYDNTRSSFVTKRLHVLESKYRKRFGMDGEFKSTSIGKKNFARGIRSFNPDVLAFYRDLFDLLEKISPIIHVNAVSKIEYLVRKIFDVHLLKQVPGVHENAFYYSITKFILTYHSSALIQALYGSADTGAPNLFREELLNHLEEVISATKGITRKEREIIALRQLHMIMSLIPMVGTITTKYEFVYNQNFVGLLRLLDERKISPQRVHLVIDQEESTFQAAKNYPFKSVRQADSTNSVYVRLADHLCGFIGRMMHALMDDKSFAEDPVTDIERIRENDLVRKRLLSEEWFNLKAEHFSLYKSAYCVLIVQQEAYWAAMTWSYFDQVSVFYSLLRYIASYKRYEDYQKYSAAVHSEYFNSACCNELEAGYSSFS